MLAVEVTPTFFFSFDHSSMEGAGVDVESMRRSLGKLHKLEESIGVRPMTWDSSQSNYVPMVPPDLSTRMLGESFPLFLDLLYT